MLDYDNDNYPVSCLFRADQGDGARHEGSGGREGQGGGSKASHGQSAQNTVCR